MSAKKRVLTVVTVIFLIAVLVAVVLLGVYFGTRKSIRGEDYFEIPYSYLPDSQKITVDRQENFYLGHPDLVMNDSGRIFVAYPNAHGRGAIIMKTSDDYGETWSERRTDLPDSWVTSQETPTLYNLGGNRLILISGCPDWYVDNLTANGFNSSLSFDGGETWSQFTNFYGKAWAAENEKKPFDGIVAMSSLTQLRDESGALTERWMGTFHDHSLTNYVSYLTIENGKEVWTEPTPLLAPWREIESRSGMCELEIIRAAAPNDDTLILLSRVENRVSRSMISFSEDEGKTWTEPKEVPYALTGDRHKAEYDPVSGKLAISFRQLIKVKQSALSLKPQIVCAGWVCWIGTFDDLLSYRDNDASNDKLGERVLILGSNAGDTGYAGTVVKNGEFLMVSYGLFERGVTQPYIMAAKFSL